MIDWDSNFGGKTTGLLYGLSTCTGVYNWWHNCTLISTMHRLWLKVLEQRSTKLPGERKGHGQVFGFFLGDLLLLCLWTLSSTTEGNNSILHFMPVYTRFFSIRKGCVDDSRSPSFHLALWHSSENQRYSKIYFQDNCVILELIWEQTKGNTTEKEPIC